MAITAPLAEFFFKEHQYRPIEGKLLTLGRQSVLFDEKRMQAMLKQFGFPPLTNIAYERDTVQAKQESSLHCISDDAFFSVFKDAKLHRMDITDYEGADILQDMCAPLAPNLQGQFDFIFNGSILDNVFDPAAAMRNISLLLKPGGRVMHIEMASRLAFEYLIFSPDWFMDYYIANQFSECRAYIAEFTSRDELLYGPWSIYEYFTKQNGDAFNLKDLDLKHAAVIVIAEKGAHSTHDAVPVQAHYRDAKRQADYLRQRQNVRYQRPVYGFGSKAAQQVQGTEQGFIMVGKAGAA